jgi:hypothetical protein
MYKRKVLVTYFLCMGILGCSQTYSTPKTKPTAQYTPIEYWNCVTRHQGKDQASQKALEDCLELYRKIDQTQSN